MHNQAADSADEQNTDSASQPTAGAETMLPFDPLRLVQAVLRRWYWPLIPVVLLFPAGLGLGTMLFQTGYTAEVQLIRRATESGFRATQFGNAFKPGELKVETLVPLMHSVNVLTKIASLAEPPLSAKQLSGMITVVPERRTELVRVALSSKVSAEEAARLVNLYGHEVVALTKELQSNEANEAYSFLSSELADMDRQLGKINQEILQFSREETYIDGDKEIEAYLRDLGNLELNLQEARIEHQSVQMRVESLRDALRKHNPVATELKSAQEKLSSLLVQYTDKNPLVIEQRDHITSLEKQLESFASPDTEDADFTGAQISDAIYLDLVKMRSDADSLVQRIDTLEGMKQALKDKLGKIPGKNLNHARLQARKSTLEEMRNLISARQTEAAVYKENALGYYRLFAETSAENVLVSGRSSKVLVAGVGLAGIGFGFTLLFILLKELADTRIRTTHDLARVTRLPLVGQLGSIDPSAGHLWEQWAFQHLAKLSGIAGAPEANHQTYGFLSAAPGEGKSTVIHALATSAAKRGRRVLTLTNTPPKNTDATSVSLAEALANPGDVRQRVESTDPAKPCWISVTLPKGHEWTAEQRSLWNAAMKQWSEIANSTLFVEIPPNFTTDGILYAETLPHVFWLSQSDQHTGGDLAKIFQFLSHSKLRLTGAILNHAPPGMENLPLVGPLIASFRPAIALALALGAQSLSAATDPAGQLSASSPPQLARWQQRLTLGPGDTITIGLYGYPNHLRKNVIVSPDGFISYLQARNLKAQGKTIDELRNELDTALAEYFRSPRTMIMPQEFRSKRYHIMGSVRRSGSYILDRPVTVIEAVAQAEGMRTGLFDHNTIELADLERCFLVRGSKRMDVDFKKLFHQGDLSQNVLLEPDDYIYVPSSSANEVYVLGAVTRPGAIGITTDATVLRLVAVRGGFLRTAYKDRILIVRGSWVQPETFIFDARAVFDGRATDFALKPKDVIYVAERPWVKAEELLDLAARAFLQSATATWTGENVGPLITQPLID